MPKVNKYVAGNTLGSHEAFLHKLIKKGAKVVEPPEAANVTIVFCPIVSRFQCDVDSALSSAKVSGCQEVILVAMHHTFDKDYRLPTHRELNDPDVVLLVDCLFFEGKGLLACPCNKKAVKMVCKKLGLARKSYFYHKSKKHSSARM